MSSPWVYEKERMLSNRLLGLAGIFFLLGFILIGRLFYLQIICGDLYLKMADKNRISVRLTVPKRGYIYDRNGVKLAENKTSFQAVLIREETTDYQKTLQNIQKLLPLDEEELERIQKEIKQKRAFMPVRIKNGLTFEEAALIQVNAPDLQGIQIEEEVSRYYPLKELTAHVAGYVSFMTEKDVKNEWDAGLLDLPGYRIGRIGAEEAYESLLRGRPGIRKTEINAYGRSVRVLEEHDAGRGSNITLTIDSRLQKAAFEALGDESGSVIVLDIHTGDILALVSTPAFDANIFTAPISKKVWNELIQNEKNPLQNKAVNGVYSPGSIFKLVVALAGLESGHITKERTVYCPGRIQIGQQYFHCWKHTGHGALTVEEALMHSCDVYFYQLAQEIGADKILSVAQRLGFGKKINIRLSGEKEGLLPSKEWKRQTQKENWRIGDTLNLSIGQGYLNATPLQLVYAVAVIANGGYRFDPHLLIAEGSDIIPLKQPLFKKEHLDLVRSGMNMVVNRAGGTGYKARFDLNGQKMAGKTASTQVRRITMKERKSGIISQDNLPWKYRDHAMFAAFAPVNNPRFAVIAVVEHGGGGAKKAAPIASAVLQETLRLYPADSYDQENEQAFISALVRQLGVAK